MHRAWLLLVIGGCDYVLRIDEVPEPPSRVVARYRFEPGQEVTDETGIHHGMVAGGGQLVPVQGPDGNQAISFPSTPNAHVVIPSSAAWSLAEGSIELWLKVPASGETMGIMSRDSVGDRNGHFTLVYVPEGLVARMQADSVAPDSDHFLCSNAPLAVDQWVHVGINVGPPNAELWIDGVRQDAIRTVAAFNTTAECGAFRSRSLIGNNDPWIFGASSALSTPGTADIPTNPFVGGAIDEVVIRSSRQLFDQR